MSSFKKYSIICAAAVIVLSSYPVYMGYSVVYDMITEGTVLRENFPKYVIPYAPIALSLIVSVLLMPILVRRIQRFSVLAGSSVSVVVFFVSELLLESKVIVTSTVASTLESWQMVMCYVPPDMYETRTWKAVDILIGEFDPLFKLHFYMISTVLIVVIINCLYGFARMIKNGDRTRSKALTVQSVCVSLFLGLCILACFTAFFRDGEITVSPLSAFLMSLFFIVLGVTVGAYTGSFLLGRKQSISVIIPALSASAVTLAMYIGEMILLSGHLYRFGTGFIFDELPLIVLAPFDITVIAASGIISAAMCLILNKKPSVE